MKELIQIEKQLEQRSIQELEEIVDTFLSSLQKLRSKYGGSNYYNYTQEKLDTTCIAQHQVKLHLLHMLKDNHLECMLKHKSKELLSKIELLS